MPWRRLLQPLARPLYQVYSRLTRGMTLGVRGLVLNEAGEVLLVEHTYMRGWHLPGGGVERGETAEQAMMRELLEEAGVSAIGRPQLVGVHANHRRLSRRPRAALPRRPMGALRGDPAGRDQGGRLVRAGRCCRPTPAPARGGGSPRRWAAKKRRRTGEFANLARVPFQSEPRSLICAPSRPLWITGGARVGRRPRRHGMREYMKFYIDGQWVDPVTPKTMDVINPATEEVAGHISAGSAADVDKAVDAARKAFETYSQDQPRGAHRPAAAHPGRVPEALRRHRQRHHRGNGRAGQPGAAAPRPRSAWCTSPPASRC